MDILDAGLYIVSTPIGNLSDISKRAENILSTVDLIICENPKHSLKLLNKLGIKKKLFSLHDYNEKILIKRIEKYQNNSSIALISDAGSPLISDPGYNLVLDYIKKDLFVTTIPGASSIISALQLSGLPVNNFKFYGFVSKNKGLLNSTADKIAESTSTSVFFVSGNRIINFLNKVYEKKSDINVSVCKEITKKNEQIFRGNIPHVLELLSKKEKSTKGEFVVIIGSGESKSQKKINSEIEKQIKKLLVKFSLTEVVNIVHKLTVISKKEIYKMALIIKND